MRILLIRHNNISDTNSRLPKGLNRRMGVLPSLGLGYVASALANAGHTVRILDLMAMGWGYNDAWRFIQVFKPDLIGLSALTPSVQTTIKFVQRLRKDFAIPIMVGGAHTSVFQWESAQYFDFVFRGEVEHHIVYFLQHWEKQKGFYPMQYDSKIIANLDDLHWPAYHLMPVHKYSSIIGLNPAMTMITSRGCPYHCSFCAKTPSDQLYRTRNTDDVADEMAHLVKSYGVREILFYDDLMPPKHVAALCESILRKGVRVVWETPQRVDLVNKEVLALMKRAGCRMLRFGVEQGDPVMMHRVDKKITLEMVRQVFAWTKEAGIETFAYFIIGYLGETPQTIQATIDLAKELDPRYVMFTKAIPLPNTKFFNEVCAAGLVDPNYWRDYSVMKRVDPMPDFVPNCDQWVMKAYREFYLRPSRIMRQMRDLGTWDGIKKNVSGLMGLIGGVEN